MQFTEAVVNLKFDEEPKYESYMALFEPLCGARSARPLQTTAPPAAKVGQKRPRDPSDDIMLDSTGAFLPLLIKLAGLNPGLEQSITRAMLILKCCNSGGQAGRHKRQEQHHDMHQCVLADAALVLVAASYPSDS